MELAGSNPSTAAVTVGDGPGRLCYSNKRELQAPSDTNTVGVADILKAKGKLIRSSGRVGWLKREWCRQSAGVKKSKRTTKETPKALEKPTYWQPVKQKNNGISERTHPGLMR